MLKTKRKKTLLENHNKLTPIDETLLKGKEKLQDKELNNSQSNY
jgi:hypothetical protein